MKKRVVITGYGTINPIGNTGEETLNAVRKNTCGIDYITQFDRTDFPIQIAAEVNVDLLEHFSKKEIKKMDRYIALSMIASREAYHMAKLDDIEDRTRIGMIISSGIGGIGTIEEEHKKMLEKGPKRVSPLFIPKAIVNMGAGNVGIDLNIQGYSSSIVSACSSSAHAIGDAFRKIQYGEADVMLAGGSEATITPLSIAGFNSLTALSTHENPKKASIPFDENRNGFVMGEGAAVLILESYDHAITRGATIYGEIAGYSSTTDAYHITSPMPDGAGGARAMNDAIKDAGLTPADIDYINAHGTSTPTNDRTETLAIHSVFGEDTDVYVSSTKSMTGHLLGAAGAVESIMGLFALNYRIIPGNIGIEKQDVECKLNIPFQTKEDIDVRAVLSTSLGFGGHNVALVFKRFDENK